MKKVMMRVLVATVLLCMAGRSFSDTVNWYSSSVFSGSSTFDVGYKPSWDYSGPWDEAWGNMADYGYQAIPQYCDWAVRILTVGSENEVFAANGNQWFDAGVDGVFYQAFNYNSVDNPLNGVAIFTRFYDNADWTLATGHADVGFTTINWPSAQAPMPPNEYFYDIGKVAIAIPEPSTALLLGTGGMVV